MELMLASGSSVSGRVAHRIAGKASSCATCPAHQVEFRIVQARVQSQRKLATAFLPACGPLAAGAHAVRRVGQDQFLAPCSAAVEWQEIVRTRIAPWIGRSVAAWMAVVSGLWGVGVLAMPRLAAQAPGHAKSHAHLLEVMRIALPCGHLRWNRAR